MVTTTGTTPARDFVASSEVRFLPRAGLDRLIEVLADDGRTVIGPTISDGTIVYDTIRTSADLPLGWGDEQAPGRYRLVERGDERAFGYAVGLGTWKRQTFPSRVPVGVAEKDEGGRLAFNPVTPDPPKVAYLGVRGCELATLADLPAGWTAEQGPGTYRLVRRADGA